MAIRARLSEALFPLFARKVFSDGLVFACLMPLSAMYGHLIFKTSYSCCSNSSSSSHVCTSSLVLLFDQNTLTGMLRLARVFGIAPRVIRSKIFSNSTNTQQIAKTETIAFHSYFSLWIRRRKKIVAVIGSHQTFCIYNVNRTVTVTLSLFLDLRV